MLQMSDTKKKSDTMLLQLRGEPQGWVGSFPKSLRVHYRISLLGNPVIMQVEPSDFRMSSVVGLPAMRDIFRATSGIASVSFVLEVYCTISSDRIMERYNNNIVNTNDRTYSEKSLL